jgi:CubicO group peptidase (beta-lactamase class C family)
VEQAHQRFADVLQTIDEWPVPLAAAAVLSSDHTGISVEKYGTSEAIQRIASVSKALFAYAVMIAIEERSLDLDESAGPLGSTVRHLLAHASGLPFEPNEGLDPDIGSKGAATGTRRVYSNIGFNVLSELLQAHSGIDPSEYLQVAVFQPLGMNHSELRGSVAKDVYSNVDDLALFALELLRPKLIARETWQAFTTIQYPELAGVVPGFGTFRPCPWGLGVEIRGSKTPHWTGTLNSPATFGHFGGTGSMLWVDPVADVALVALTGREFGPWAGPLWRTLGDEVLSVARDCASTPTES